MTAHLSHMVYNYFMFYMCVLTVEGHSEGAVVQTRHRHRRGGPTDGGTSRHPVPEAEDCAGEAGGQPVPVPYATDGAYFT